MQLESLTNNNLQANLDQSVCNQVNSSLFEIIAKSFSFQKANDNKIIFITKSIYILHPLAISFCQNSPALFQKHREIIILIDFQSQEIQQMKELLKKIILESGKKQYFEKQILENIQIINLSNLVIEKRRKYYLKAGIYSISCQIFMTDLLRGCYNIDKRFRIKFIVKLCEKVKNYYNYYAWMTTYIKIKQQESQGQQKAINPIIFISNSPHHYSDPDELKRIYRTFFCKKILIWPFGRSQIHKQLTKLRQNNIFKQWQHIISLSKGELLIKQIIMRLFYFLKKDYLKKNGQKAINPQQILYGFDFERNNVAIYQDTYRQFDNLQYLLYNLENTDKINLLNSISAFIQDQTCDLWTSNNSQIIEMIEQLQTTLKQSIFTYEKDQEKTITDLSALLQNYSQDQQINSINACKYKCHYKLQLKMIIRPQINEKIKQLIKIIEDIKPSKKDTFIKSQQQISQLTVNLGMKCIKEKQHHNIVIICNKKYIYNYIGQNLNGYLYNRTYLHYLYKILQYLAKKRSLRLSKIKKMFQKNKVKKEDQDNAITGDRKNWLDENRWILQQTLYRQIFKLRAIVEQYEVSNKLKTDKYQKTQNQDILFQANQQQIQIKDKFIQSLLAANFKIIDFDKVLNLSDHRRQFRYVFETDSLKKNVIIEHVHWGAQLTNFYQLLNVYRPQTIIFYNPNTILLRSLYLYQIQYNQENLKNVHMFNFENSFQSKRLIQQITKEDKAFWSISQHRSQIPQFMQSPYARIRQINFRDKIQESKYRLNNRKDLFNEYKDKGKVETLTIEIMPSRRKILVDTRQFKSSLPSYLYHYGFDVIPVFLKVADYILTDDIAVQKKSVHTRDLHNSLRSQRLEDQLKRMNNSFKHSYLLIECQQPGDCKKSNFTFLDGKNGNKARYELRKRLMQIMFKFPNILLIWSTSVQETCFFFKQLKNDKFDPDLSKYSKQKQQQETKDTLTEINQVSQKKQYQA